ncbi:hypothetical protein Taro_007955 [Colocasia esculenta]|uniref:Erythromycin biosynthesis protein CIII-like C-terminal domain-containing protein n=1 Tax=Colocasia esculenta TaxID=4460 RepID=A0A843TSK8_COLES|nr:hypothetical protein [Colocasia esculenta]
MESEGGRRRARAVFMAFGTQGDVYPIAAIAAALACDQMQYDVILITHSAHKTLSPFLEARRVDFVPVPTPPVLSFDDDSTDSGEVNFSLQKKAIQMEHRNDCLSTIEKIFGNGQSMDDDFILINFFALEGWSLAELFQVRCVIAAPYVVPYSAPSSFERRFKDELPLLYRYLQEAPVDKVCWNDVLHWMWPLFTEDWGSWRSDSLKLSPFPFTVLCSIMQGSLICPPTTAQPRHEAAPLLRLFFTEAVGDPVRGVPSPIYYNASGGGVAGGGAKVKQAIPIVEGQLQSSAAQRDLEKDGESEMDTEGARGGNPLQALSNYMSQMQDPVTGLPLWHFREKSPLLLYGFSNEVVECPGYWPSNVHVCGFWFLPTDWQFSCGKCREAMLLYHAKCPGTTNELCSSHADLRHFITKSSSSCSPIFVGLSSVGRMGFLKNPQAFLLLLKAVTERTDHKFILFSSGYEPLDAAIRFTASVNLVESHQISYNEDCTLLFDGRLFCFSGVIPYSWLFPRCAAVIHHGGSGSTAAAIQAGVPQV